MMLSSPLMVVVLMLAAKSVDAGGVVQEKRQGTPSISASTASSTVAAAPGTDSAVVTPSATVEGVPPLSAIVFGMPSGATYPPTTTFTEGTIPTASGLSDEPLPAFTFSMGEWPTMDKTPPTDSDEVNEWMKELDGHDIPDLEATIDGTCASDPDLAGDAENRGWWSCGHYTRDTDITLCPDKYTWGVSFDDGPAPYSDKLLSYLEEKDISATFFVVGSRVIEYPDLLREEYMAGHEISVHTWSHPHLTTKTNQEIVAELGWTRKAVKEVLGVTPVTMRPPYGDIDDRVRAISLAMGLVPIIWTVANGVAFDTNDWNVAGGLVDGETCVDTFKSLIGNATQIDSGFIVLEHDLFEITVDLAIGYNLENAQKHEPAFTLKAIGQCNSIPTTDMYRETTTNTSFPYSSSSTNSDGGDGGSGSGSGSGSSQSSSGSADSHSNSALTLTSLASALSAALLSYVA